MCKQTSPVCTYLVPNTIIGNIALVAAITCSRGNVDVMIIALQQRQKASCVQLDWTSCTCNEGVQDEGKLLGAGEKRLYCVKV